ncbi:glycosyltransferase [Buttiauxella gaviniae]|uniref:Glycosyltransferase n=1 Tax=Buttiauxella gaviniae TaxID=82990 RepID=A0ABV3NXV0_9ENTR
MQSIDNQNKITIAVVMATYNGAQFIAQQLDSILKQKIDDFYINIYISDDSSIDDTWGIISAYESSCSNIKIVLNESDHGPANNFINALRLTNDEQYYIFADQDDVWFDTKVACLYRAAEQKMDNYKPGLVYCNAEVNDKTLSKCHKNLYESNYKQVNNFNDLLFMNGGVQGASMIINKKMKLEILSYRSYIYMHDQLATYLGVLHNNIFYIPNVLMNYRQHDNNVIGSNVGFINKFKKLITTPLLNEKSCQFIFGFCKTYSNLIPDRDFIKLKLVSNIENSGRKLLFMAIYNDIKINGSRMQLIIKIFLKTLFFKVN